MPTRTITVAAGQLACTLGDRKLNLTKATELAEAAAVRGAELLLFPELMPGGYTLTESIWDTAESFDGPTIKWMKGLSSRLHMYIGTTFLEVEDEHFY